MSRAKQKPIKLNYMINGAKFRRMYLPTEHRAARERIEALQESGVTVKVRNWPKRVEQRTVTVSVVAVEPL